MKNFLNYLWIILLSIYIISPIDANPLFFDDLIAAGALFYILYKNSKQKEQRQQYSNDYRQSQTGHQSQQNSGAYRGPLTLDEACRLLGVNPNSSLDEISSAYREKMAKSHPDKVSHLSEELQEKAKEITLRLNEAYDLLKRHRE